MKRFQVRVALFLLLAACSVHRTLAEGPELSELGSPVRIEEAKAGTLLFVTERKGIYLPAPTLETRVWIEVAGLVARTRIEQRFENPTEYWVEGVYVFPLPEDAAVDRLRMTVGDRVIEGEIQEREQAKKTYEKAKRSGRKASLVEQERPNIFTTSVANIGPAEVLAVSIEFQEEIRLDAGVFSLRFPLVVGPRYIPGRPEPRKMTTLSGTGWALPTDQVPDADRITPPVCGPHPRQGELEDSPPQTALQNVSIEVTIDAGLSLERVESPSHAISVVESASLHTVRLAEGRVPADRDFILEWRPEGGLVPMAAAFSQELEGERYVLLTVLPPADAGARWTRLSRETIFVIDTSGSMSGTSIGQARAALLLALDRLRPDDRFNVVRFSNSAKRLFPGSVHASSSYVEEALQWVAGLEAGGGTEILGALKTALPGRSPEGVLRQIVFITDGSVGNEESILAWTHENLAENRIFTVGIGSAPNAYFMRRLAEMGRGTYTFIGRIEEVAERMGELFRKLESPVMKDLEVIWDDALAEAWPQEIGDLYLGEPIQVVARLPVGGTEVRVRGWRRGQPWEESFRLEERSSAQGLDKLWARRKIASLMESGYRGGDAEQIRSEIVEVALRHHLVSKYTSLVAVDSVRSAPEGTLPKTRALPVQLPAGWKGHWPGPRSLPQTGAGSTLYLCMGTILLLAGATLLASGLWQRRRRLS